MKFSLQKEEKYTILTLEQEKLDSTLAPNLKSEFVSLNTAGVKNIILNMEHVRYTDSSGLSAILVGNRLCMDHKGLMVLTKVNEHVMKLITISQLQNILNIQPTLEEAVDAVFLHEIEGNLTEEGGADDE